MAEYIEKKRVVDELTRIALQVPASKTRTVARCISAVELLPSSPHIPRFQRVRYRRTGRIYDTAPIVGRSGMEVLTMAKRLIDADALKCRFLAFMTGAHTTYLEDHNITMMVNQAPTVDAVELPCKIGDYVWAIRNFKGHKQPQRGIVSDMYFTRDMQLNIVVKYVARGKWGETVFAGYAEASAVINGGQAPQREDV